MTFPPQSRLSVVAKFFPPACTIPIIYLFLCFLDNVLMGNRFANNQGVINLANNFTCGRNSVMGNIVTYASPYLYPFVVEYSLIGAAVVFAMWRSIGSNPRYYSPSSLPKNKQTKRGYSLKAWNFCRKNILRKNFVSLRRTVLSFGPKAGLQG